MEIISTVHVLPNSVHVFDRMQNGSILLGISVFQLCKECVLDSEYDYSVWGIKGLLTRKCTSLNQLNWQGFC